MSVAFYAPLKAPSHPVPSGDRSIARALMSALRHAGHEVEVASDLRLYDGTGDPDHQARLAEEADREVHRLCAAPQATEWRHWLTYHNYYKAPDLIGPRVSAALNIPYYQVESTRAKKRLTGPWAGFAAAAEAASDAAQTIFYFTHHDAETLLRDAPDGQKLVHLPPFLDRIALPAPSDRSGPLLTVAMMRPGDKLASYTLVAEALRCLPDSVDWHLDIAGDGDARDDVARLMASFGNRVSFLGQMGPEDISARYTQAAALLWPGVNEAFGMVYLEAQAAGVPVIAQNRPGVRDVVAGDLCAPEAGAPALADKIVRLYADPAFAKAAAQKARDKVAGAHLLPHAAQILGATLEAAQ